MSGFFGFVHLQGANASALEKEIGSEQFPVNEHYFGLVNVSNWCNVQIQCFVYTFTWLVLTLIWLHSIIDFSLETPATATRCCRLCTSAGRFGRRSWRTAVSLGGRRTCSPAWLTCFTVLPTRREKWASYHPRSSSHGFAKRMVRGNW